MDNLEATKNLNIGVKTVAASVGAGLFRIFLMPVDTVKVGRMKRTRKWPHSKRRGPYFSID
jgi:hypothetical protein